MSGAARLPAIDALRGFDMVWIIGGDVLAHRLADWTGWPPLLLISDQLQHAEWIGCNLYDLIFPLFMFLSGVSLGLAFARPERASDATFAQRAWTRAILLFGLGVFYNWGWRVSLEQVRFASVLGLIGATYLLTVGVMLLARGWAARLMALAAIWIVVAGLQLWFPTPGFGAGALTPEGSVNGWIDRLLLPGRLHGNTYDPEGLLAIVSGASITLAGALAGGVVAPGLGAGGALRLRRLVLAGVLSLAVGLLLWPVYPPIKKLWTVSFDLLAIGACLLLLAGAVWLFARPGAARLGSVFAVIGANSVLIYMTARYLCYPVFKETAAWAPSLGAGVVVAVLLLQWAALRELYRRKIYLRV